MNRRDFFGGAISIGISSSAVASALPVASRKLGEFADGYPIQEKIAFLEEDTLNIPDIDKSIILNNSPRKESASNLSIVDFGAVCDGVVDDTHAIQSAIDYVHKRGINVIFGVPGKARITDSIILRDNVKFLLNGLTIFNDRNSGRSYNRMSPFLLGFWSPAHNGRRPLGSSSEFVRKIDIFKCKNAISSFQNYVEMDNPDDAKKFSIGSVYFLRSKEFFIQTSTGDEIELPLDSSLVRVVDVKNAKVFFQTSCGFETKTPPYLCCIKPGAEDGGLPIHFVQNVEVCGGHLIGRVAVGNNNTGAYGCSFHSFTCDVSHVVQANGLAHCRIYNFSGSFKGRVVEAKFCAHDSMISDFILFDKLGASSAGMFSIGEGARNLLVSRFMVQAPNFSGEGAHLFQIQYGRSCVFDTGSVIAPNCTSAAINFFSSKVFAPVDNLLRNLKITHGSKIGVLFSSGIFEPHANRVIDCELISSASSDVGAIALNGGDANEIRGCRFNQGGVFISRKAKFNIVSDNFTASSVFVNSGVFDNTISNNRSGGR